jgi:hypothetical protein
VKEVAIEMREIEITLHNREVVEEVPIGRRAKIIRKVIKLKMIEAANTEVKVKINPTKGEMMTTMKKKITRTIKVDLRRKNLTSSKKIRA